MKFFYFASSQYINQTAYKGDLNVLLAVTAHQLFPAVMEFPLYWLLMV